MELRSSWNRGLLLFCFFQQHCGLFRCIVWFWVDCPFKHSTVVISLKLGRKCRCDISLGYREETVSTLDLSFKGSARLTKVLRPFENAFPWLKQEKHTLTLKLVCWSAPTKRHGFRIRSTLRLLQSNSYSLVSRIACFTDELPLLWRGVVCDYRQRFYFELSWCKTKCGDNQFVWAWAYCSTTGEKW